MKTHKQILLPGLESFDEGADVMLDHTETLGAEYEYAETLDGREVEICTDGIDGAETDIASLEALLEAIEDARATGMESWSAQFTSIHVNAIQKRYGIDGETTALPSLESYSGRQARLAVSVSMESVKETIAKIWEWIKKQFFAFMDMIRNFYRHLTKNLDLVIEKANAVKNVARQMKYDGGDQINLYRHGNKITVDGKIPQTLPEITSILNLVGSSNRVPEEKFDMIRHDVEEAVTSRRDPNSEGGKNFTNEVPIPAGFSLLTANKMAGVFSGAFKIYSSPVLPGDRTVMIGVFGNDNRPDAYNFQTMSTVTGKVSTHRLNVDRQTACTTLSSSDTFTLCQRIVKTAASLKTSRDAMETHIRKTKQSIESIMRKYQGDSITDKWVSKLVTWYYKNNALYAGELARHVEAVGYDICVGFLALAEKSVAVAKEMEERRNAAKTDSTQQSFSGNAGRVLPAPSA